MEWIAPCNLQDYALADAFDELGKIEWGKAPSMKGMADGDILYLYESRGVHEIGWKCQVTDANRNVSLIDDSKYSKSSTSNAPPFIEIKPMLAFTLRHLLSLAVLREHGLRGNVQGPSRINAELSAYIHSVEQMESDENEQNFLSMPMEELRTIARKHSLTNPKVRRTSTKIISRDRYISAYAKKRAMGFCQLCGKPAPFKDKAGNPYLESHHIVWLSKGGEDSLENTVALCPNCHRKMHVLSAPSDIDALLFAASQE